MPLDEYYPSLATLLDASAIPGDFQLIENTAQEGIDALLSKFYYKDLVVEVSQDGTQRYYSLTLLLEELKLPLFGSGMNLVFFYGTEADLSEIPLIVEWKWSLYKYLSKLEGEGFSYAPEAFVGILFELAEIEDSTDFFRQVVDAFLDDGDNTYESFFDAFRDRINAYNDFTEEVEEQIGIISAQLDLMETEISRLLTETNEYTTGRVFETYLENPVLSAAVTEIEEAIDTLNGQSDVLVKLFEDVLISVLTAIPDPEEGLARMLTLFRNWFADIDEQDLYDLLIPQFGVELPDITMALEFPRSWLTPMKEQPDGSGIYVKEEDENILAALTYTVGKLKYSTKSGFEFEDQGNFAFSRAMIGKTGIIVSFDGLKVDMSKDSNIEEADADGRPQDFMGIYCETAEIILPPDWFKDIDDTTASIVGKQFLIGTGGISGKISLNALGGDNTLWTSLGADNGFRAGFTSFDIRFKQNKVLSSSIAGSMEIPGFTYPEGTPEAGEIVQIDISGHIHDDGSFNLTAVAEPPYPISYEDVFIYHVASLELGKKDDDFYIGTSGKVEFQGFLKDTLKLDSIEIDRMRIYSDGSFEFEGGTINLLEPIVLPLGPVEITVTAIHFGSHQKEVDGEMRKFNYFGFDGGISVDPLGIEVRGDGVKFYFCTDNKSHANKLGPYLHIQTLYIDLTIPASTPVAIINGWLSIPEPGVSEEYGGGVKLQLPQARIAGSVDMKLAPKYPAFILDASFDFPVPIPLGPVGIYGFRGLLGYRYVPDKSPESSWYNYYKTAPRGIHVQKFKGPNETANTGSPIAIGAGASFGTTFDGGTVVNIKAMVLLAIPSLFVIDGKLAVLSARLGLEDPGEPPFFAFIAVGSESMEIGIGADFNMPTKSGDILKLKGDIQIAFFFNDASRWYVNIGTKTNPIEARVLTLFDIKAYLMLSSQGIEAGARGEISFKRKYGLIKVGIWAYIEIGGKISFERSQFGAYLAGGFGAEVDVKMFSAYVSFDAIFGVEAPKPFRIYGEFKLCVRFKILWVFSFKFCGNLSIEWELNKEIDTNPINPLINEKNEGFIPGLVKGINMYSNEIFELAYLGEDIEAIRGVLDSKILEKIIPLDTYIDIKTEKGLLAEAISSKIARAVTAPKAYYEYIPPVSSIKGRDLRQVRHTYSIVSLDLKSWNPDIEDWADYHPYVALNPDDAEAITKPIGQFQLTGQNNAIRILGTTPLDYTSQGQPGWFIPEQHGITAGMLTCEAEKYEPVCVNFLEKDLGTKYYCETENQQFFSGEVAFYLMNKKQGDYAEIISENNPFTSQKSLKFKNTNLLRIRLPEVSLEVKLKLTSYSKQVRIRYYAVFADTNLSTVFYGHPDPNAADRSQPYEVIIDAEDLNNPIQYKKEDWHPVSQIEIQALMPNQEMIDRLIEQIEAQNQQNFLIAVGMANGEIKPTDALESQLNKLQQSGCKIITNKCKKDKHLCYLYEVLLHTYNELLKNPGLFTINQIQDYKRYLEQIVSIIEELGTNRRTSELQKYYEELKLFTQKPSKDNYQKLWKSTQKILEFLKTKGDCDCKETRSKKCHTLLHSVCWLSLEKSRYNVELPAQAAIEQQIQETIAAITDYLPPIWRPDTSYVVQFRLKDEVGGQNLEDGSLFEEHYFDYVYGFTTGGPLGYFHKHEKATYGDITLEGGIILEDANGIKRDAAGNKIAVNPDNPITPHPESYQLTNLKGYIDYNRSYPNADGNLLSSKPLFYQDETTSIMLYFSKPFASHFFKTWPAYNGKPEIKGQIRIVIKDPREGAEIINPPGASFDESQTTIPQAIESWEDDPNPVISAILEQYANLIDSGECVPFLGDEIIPASSYLKVELKYLKPQKLYTAIVNNQYDLNQNAVLEPDSESELPNQSQEESVEVHRFTFQTSRYANFAEQINSYLLTDAETGVQKAAVFDVELPLSVDEIHAALDTAKGNANSLGDSIEANYQHQFDRIIEGLWKMPPMPKAQTTEFNVIRNTSDNRRMVALLIRNPEPFNNPRIPLTEIQDTIEIFGADGSIQSNYTKLFSKDYSQILLIRDDMQLSETLNLRFTYKFWDGKEYKVPSLEVGYSSDEIGTITISNLELENN